MSELLILLVVGYIIGSISPGHFFGRVVKGIDIRDYGNHNTGATNAYKVVGPAYGIITAILDILKASLVFVYAVNRIHPDLAIAVGLMVVIGQKSAREK